MSLGVSEPNISIVNTALMAQLTVIGAGLGLAAEAAIGSALPRKIRNDPGRSLRRRVGARTVRIIARGRLKRERAELTPCAGQNVRHKMPPARRGIAPRDLRARPISSGSDWALRPPGPRPPKPALRRRSGNAASAAEFAPTPRCPSVSR